jgi:4'-phosphopantetheinyl transferase
VHFNLSNTPGLVVCAVGGVEALGVDVEDTERRTEPDAIAHRFFSVSEAEELLALPTDAQRRARFFALWTLKESYIKARGMGLAIPLGRFSFSLGPDEDIGIAFDPRLEDDPACWHFALLRAPPRHLVAVALGSGMPMKISAAHVVPLRDLPAG